MQINNNISNQQNFGSLKIKDKALKTLVQRGDWPAFKECLPAMQRRGEKADVVFFVNHDKTDKSKKVRYACAIFPKNTLFDNPITRFLGIASKKPSGKSHLENRCWKPMETADFTTLYDEAYKARRKAVNDIKKEKLAKLDIQNVEMQFKQAKQEINKKK